MEKQFAICVKNLNYSTTQESLRNHFSDYSPTSVVILREKGGRSKGIAFVNFDDQECFKASMKNLNGSSLDGRNITVEKKEEKISSQRTNQSQNNRNNFQESERKPREFDNRQSNTPKPRAFDNRQSNTPNPRNRSNIIS